MALFLWPAQDFRKIMFSFCLGLKCDIGLYKGPLTLPLNVFAAVDKILFLSFMINDTLEIRNVWLKLQ